MSGARYIAADRRTIEAYNKCIDHVLWNVYGFVHSIHAQFGLQIHVAHCAWAPVSIIFMRFGVMELEDVNTSVYFSFTFACFHPYTSLLLWPQPCIYLNHHNSLCMVMRNCKTFSFGCHMDNLHVWHACSAVLWMHGLCMSNAPHCEPAHLHAKLKRSWDTS